jgi:hypothetical protein
MGEEKTEKFLRPGRSDTDLTNSDVERRWLHWKQTLLIFLGSILEKAEESKWQLLLIMWLQMSTSISLKPRNIQMLLVF